MELEKIVDPIQLFKKWFSQAEEKEIRDYKIAAGELTDDQLGDVTEFFTISGGSLLIDATGGQPNHLYVSGNIDASGIYPYASGKGQIGSPERPWGSGFFTSLEI